MYFKTPKKCLFHSLINNNDKELWLLTSEWGQMRRRASRRAAVNTINRVKTRIVHLVLGFVLLLLQVFFLFILLIFFSPQNHFLQKIHSERKCFLPIFLLFLRVHLNLPTPLSLLSRLLFLFLPKISDDIDHTLCTFFILGFSTF